MKDNEFDQLVKATMQNGTEEVPAGMWAAVQSQLSSAAPATTSKTITPWFWSTGAALLAAAAVTVAVVFSGREEGADRIEIVQSETSSLADVTENETVCESSEFTSEFVPSSVTNPYLTCDATASEASVETSAEVESEAEVETTEPVAEETTAAASAEESAEATNGETINTTTTNSHPVRSEKDGTESVKQEEKAWSDPFEELDRAEKASSRSKTGVALTAFGNAASNTGKSGNGSAGVMRAPAAVPTETTVTETGESSYMIPLSFGVGAKINFAERFALGLGVNGTYLSRTYAGTYREVDENGVITRSDSYSDIRNQQYYLGIPLNVYCSIISNKHVDFYAYVGGSVDKCVSSTHKMVGADNSVINYKEDLPFFSNQGFSYSAGGGIGVEFLLGNHLGLYIDPSLKYRFRGTAPESIWTKQPLMFGFEAGLRIRL